MKEYRPAKKRISVSVGESVRIIREFQESGLRPLPPAGDAGRWASRETDARFVQSRALIRLSWSRTLPRRAGTVWVTAAEEKVW